MKEVIGNKWWNNQIMEQSFHIGGFLQDHVKQYLFLADLSNFFESIAMITYNPYPNYHTSNKTSNQ